MPSLTPVSPPDRNAPRFTIHRFADDIHASLVRVIAINNLGEVLCSAEDSEPFLEPLRPGHPPITRYRTVRTRYYLYKDGELTPITECNEFISFLPVAINDRSQVLAFHFDPEEPPHAEFPSSTGRLYNPTYMPPISAPSPRYSRLVLWEKGKIRDLNVLKSLFQAGLPERFQYFLNSATISMNTKEQILIGLENLYLWEKGTAHQIGSLGMGPGDRVFMNNLGTIVRHGDQYRSAPDGTNVYPTYMISVAGEGTARALDFGYGTFVQDLNDRNELLLGKMFLSAPDAPRTHFSIWDGKREHIAMTVNGRTPARFNQARMILAWRQLDYQVDWHSLFAGSGKSSNSVAVLWYNQKLYDLNTLLPPGSNVVSIIDLNDRGEILAQIRRQGKAETVLLTPDPDFEQSLLLKRAPTSP